MVLYSKCRTQNGSTINILGIVTGTVVSPTVDVPGVVDWGGPVDTTVSVVVNDGVVVIAGIAVKGNNWYFMIDKM